MTLRPAIPEDGPVLAAMLSEQTPWRELGYDPATCLARVTERPEEVVVGAGPDGAPWGFLRWQAHGFLGQPYLMLLAVAPERHRQGVGRALLGWLEVEVFERRGAANLFLLASAFNDRALAFYRSQGYAEVGRLPDYICAGMDEVIFRKSRRPLNSPRRHRDTEGERGVRVSG